MSSQNWKNALYVCYFLLVAAMLFLGLITYGFSARNIVIAFAVGVAAVAVLAAVQAFAVKSKIQNVALRALGNSETSVDKPSEAKISLDAGYYATIISLVLVVILATVAYYQHSVFVTAVAVGAIGGLAHELAQNHGKYMLPKPETDGVSLGGLFGMILGAIAGIVYVEGIVQGTSTTVVDTKFLAGVFLAGVALKGLAEAAVPGTSETENVIITKAELNSAKDTLSITVTNKGSKTVTFKEAKVDDKTEPLIETVTLPCDTKDQTVKVKLATAAQWQSGSIHDVQLTTKNGNAFAYRATAT
jgi:hypothetical protein